MKPALLLSATLLVAACSTPPRAPLPTHELARRSGTSQQTLAKGHAVYTAHCGRCHEPVLPKDVSREDWHLVVPGMAWNAGISPAEEKALYAYILAARQ